MTLMFVNRHAKTCTKVCALSASMMNECRQACLGASTDLIIVLAVNIASFRRLARLVCLLVRNEQTLDNAHLETDKHQHKNMWLYSCVMWQQCMPYKQEPSVLPCEARCLIGEALVSHAKNICACWQ